MVLWKSELDPFVSPLPTSSPAFLPVYFNVPGFASPIHIALYLPTSGKDPEFVSALSDLDLFIEEIASTHSCPIYIRRDVNYNPKNIHRYNLLKHFCSKHKLVFIDFQHPSPHYFIGEGLHDAQLDVLPQTT